MRKTLRATMDLIKIILFPSQTEGKQRAIKLTLQLSTELILPDLTFPFKFFWVSVILFLLPMIGAPSSLYNIWAINESLCAPEAAEIIKKHENTEDVHKTQAECNLHK